MSVSDWSVIKQEPGLESENSVKVVPMALVTSTSSNSCMRPPPPPGPPRQRTVFLEVKQERNGHEEPSSSIPDLGRLFSVSFG